MAFTLEKVSTGLTVVSLAIAVCVAWIALPLDANLKKLQLSTGETERRLKETESRLKEAESRLKEAESSRKLTFDLYQEVKVMLAKEAASERDENALRVLLETLAEDPFRSKLLNVLAIGARNTEVKQLAKDSAKFFDDQVAVALKPEPAPGKNSNKTIGSYDVDVFYCTSNQAKLNALADNIVALKLPGETGHWRPRLLPDSINQQSGYRVSENEIRYNAPGESEVALELQKRLAAAGIVAKLRVSQTPTRWYLSIFACGA